MCMGAQDSPTASAVNNAIFIMFGVLGLIFSGIGAVVFNFYRRSQNGSTPGTLAAMANGYQEARNHA